MRLFSWNVNGIRSVIEKGEFAKFIETYQPDILCLQETKAKQGQAEIDLPIYKEYWSNASRPGYSGTAIFTKHTPLSTSTTFAGTVPAKHRSTPLQVPYLQEGLWESAGLVDEFGDATKEGRLITAEFENFYLVNSYSPHTKRELERLPLKRRWDNALLEHIKTLEQAKPVVLCGDLNIAHQPIDLANPKQNETNAGYTAEERADFDQFTKAGLIDTFRNLHPDETGAYTWWTWRAKARARNVGWRIDYFIVSENILGKVKAAAIHPEQLGSDHCPISLELK
ncbi:MAG: exodeoxyribonuclease III [Candidatus Nomurabacteria bacterium]|jgi:exodeoxyribonuclease-3|nr:exodeoxyribonuclease III [Candidatus Nomurabacteria bacterium]